MCDHADRAPRRCFVHVYKRYNFDTTKGPVFIKWFEGAQTNITYNCLDRHVEAGHGDKVR